MKLKIVIMVIAISLSICLVSCDRSTPDNEKTQKELKDTQRMLLEVQTALQKIKIDINDLQNEKKLVTAQLEKTKTELMPALKTFDQFKQQADALAAELDIMRVKMTSVTASLDKLQQQASTVSTKKNDVPAKVKLQAASPTDIYKSQDQTNEIETAAKPQHDPSLGKKLQEAESYVQAGNWQAAERLLLEIQAADANYPGLDALNSRIQSMKIRIKNQN